MLLFTVISSQAASPIAKINVIIRRHDLRRLNKNKTELKNNTQNYLMPPL